MAILAGQAQAIGLEITLAGEVEGEVTIDLFQNSAPNHVERIVTLAREGKYDGVVFHRVIEGNFAQTGDIVYGNFHRNLNMSMTGKGGSDLGLLELELSDVLFQRGVVGMARREGLDTADSQFFILLVDTDELVGEYTAVGRVTSGMELIDQIKIGEGENGEVYGWPDRMETVKVID